MVIYKSHQKRFSPLKIRFHLLILLVLSVIFLGHALRTGLFLYDHFLPDDQTSDLVDLEMKLWRESSYFQQAIARHVHQIWISSEPMPDKFRSAADSCIAHHLNYTYTLWTSKKLLRWLEAEYSWFLPTYHSYRYDMQRIDAMKYFLLFHFGGVYVDLDIKCHVGDLITAMLPKNGSKAEPDIIFHMGGEGISANTDVMAAKGRHPFFKFAMQHLKAAHRWFYFYHFTIILSAGPTYLYGIFRKFPLQDDFYFVSNELLWGKLVSGVGGATWYGKDTLVLLFLIQHKYWLVFFLIFIAIAVKYWRRK